MCLSSSAWSVVAPGGAREHLAAAPGLGLKVRAPGPQLTGIRASQLETDGDGHNDHQLSWLTLLLLHLHVLLVAAAGQWSSNEIELVTLMRHHVRTNHLLSN